MNDEFRIGTNNGPIVTGGENKGTIKGGTINYASPESTAELIELLQQLRADVATAEIPKREVIDDALDDVTTYAENAVKSDPAVALSRWEKVKTLLSGLSQFTELIAKISEHVTKLFT